jgi:hypothetical protein
VAKRRAGGSTIALLGYIQVNFEKPGQRLSPRLTGTGAASVLAAPVGVGVVPVYGTKTMPLGVSGPMTVTLLSAPVVRLIVPSELAG